MGRTTLLGNVTMALLAVFIGYLVLQLLGQFKVHWLLFPLTLCSVMWVYARVRHR